MALVMYDLDGTLLDTAGEIAQAVNLTLSEFDRPPVSQDDVRRWIGHGTGWLMEQAWHATKVGKSDQPFTEVMERFKVHYAFTAGIDSQPFPCVMETLDKVRGLGIKQAVVTNKEGRFTDRVIDAHHLREYFDLIISGDTLPFKKPNPGVLVHCIQTLNETLTQSLFIGDSEIDVATAKAAGVTCWAVPYGYNHGQPIENAQPQRVIADISVVPDFFRSH